MDFLSWYCGWVKHNQSKVQANWHMMAIMPSYVLVKNSLIDWQAWGQKLMIDRLGYIKDVTPEEGVSSLNGSKSEYR